jgi:hypothetical protein
MQDVLDRIDAEMARLRADLDRLATARAVLAGLAPAPVSPRETPPGKAEPRRARGAGPKDDPRRRAVAELLARSGPIQTAAIASRLNIPKGSMSGVLKCPWFEKAGPGKFEPYQLTDAGRAALAEPGAPSAATAATPAGT